MRKTTSLHRPLVGLVSAVLLVGLLAAAAPPQQVGEVGYTVGEFSLPTYDGGAFTHNDLRGKVTMLIFWYAT
jgi:cytochrome oxidase Cu insertion factor (SCO1/SenC/PrrC family)